MPFKFNPFTKQLDYYESTGPAGGGASWSGFAAMRADVQDVPDDTPTTVVFSTEHYDIADEYNYGNGIFTPNYNGYYQCNWSTILDSVAWTTGEQFTSSLVKNDTLAEGTAWSAFWIPWVDGTYKAVAAGSNVVYLAAADTLRVQVHQNTGGLVQLDNDGKYNFFSVHRIG